MAVFDAFFRALPWFLPGTLVGVVLGGMLAYPAGRALRANPMAVWAFTTTVVAFATLTMSPTLGEIGNRGSSVFSLAVALPPPAALLSISGDSMNLVAGIALGFVGRWLATSAKASWPLVACVLMPFVGEAVQWLIPSFGRLGFVLSDVLVNELGLGLGVLLATAGSARRSAGSR